MPTAPSRRRSKRCSTPTELPPRHDCPTMVSAHGLPHVSRRERPADAGRTRSESAYRRICIAKDRCHSLRLLLASKNGVHGRAARAAAGMGGRGTRLLRRGRSRLRVQGRWLRRRHVRHGQLRRLGTPDVRSGAFEDMAAGRSSDVSCACHWAVNAAASAQHGQDVRKGILGLPVRDLRRRGLRPDRPGATWPASRSGSATTPAATTRPCRRWSASSTATRSTLELRRAARSTGRGCCCDGRRGAVNVWGAPAYLLEQRGFRKLVDTTFVMSFLLAPAADADDVERYFRGAAARPAGDRPRAAPLHPALGQGDAGRPARARRRPPVRAGRAGGAAALHPGDVRAHPGLDARMGPARPHRPRRRPLRRDRAGRDGRA